MENVRSRNALIMKLSKTNLKFHNVDDPMWKIEKFLSDIENQRAKENDSFEGIENQRAKENDSFEGNIQTSNDLQETVESEQTTAHQESNIISPMIRTGDKESSEMGLIELFENQDKEDNQVSHSNDSVPSDEHLKHTEQYVTVAKAESNSIALKDNELIKSQDNIHPDSSMLPLDAIRESGNSSASSSSSSSSSSRSEPFGSGKSEMDSDYHMSSSVTNSSNSEDENYPERQNIGNKNNLVPTQNSMKKTAKNNSNEDDDLPKKRGRKRKFNEYNWKKNERKRLRNSGKSYTSVKVVKQADGTKIKRQATRPERKLLPPCTDKCRLKCKDKITEECRKTIFEEYWNLADLQRQRIYIASAMTPIIKPKYSNPKRALNNAYYFQLQEKKHRVCKKFFISTLGITTRTIRTIIEKQKEKKTHGIIENEARGKHKNHKARDGDILEGIRDHIKSIPRVESHYCRARTQKEYIEGTKTIADLHRDYMELCETKRLKSASYRSYYDIFTKEFNIDFYFPKKDQCDLCLEFQNASAQGKELIKETYERHLQEKDLSRLERENDKKAENYVVTYDLQATLPCPIGNASSFYYISKLNMYNLTLASSRDNDVSCYVWHEGEGKRGANEIGSCVWHFLNNVNTKAIKDKKLIDIVFYTDNCTGQNKNKFIFALYSHAVNKLSNINIITHKYLVRGHTQNDADNIHSVIGKQISRYKKAAAIYVPEQYITLIRQAKKTGKPYTVYEWSHGDFFDLKDLTANMGMKDNYKTSDGETVKTSDIKVFEVRKDSPADFFCKTSYAEDTFVSISMFSRRSSGNLKNMEIKKLYKNKLGIPENKKKGIISLVEKNIIPSFYHSFYLNL